MYSAYSFLELCGFVCRHLATSSNQIFSFDRKENQVLCTSDNIFWHSIQGCTTKSCQRKQRHSATDLTKFRNWKYFVLLESYTQISVLQRKWFAILVLIKVSNLVIDLRFLCVDFYLEMAESKCRGWSQ